MSAGVSRVGAETRRGVLAMDAENNGGKTRIRERLPASFYLFVTFLYPSRVLLVHYVLPRGGRACNHPPSTTVRETARCAPVRLHRCLRRRERKSDVYLFLIEAERKRERETERESVGERRFALAINAPQIRRPGE